MKPLNITDEERDNMFVTFDTNKYVLYCKKPYGFLFLSTYQTKEDFETDMELNNIKPQIYILDKIYS